MHATLESSVATSWAQFKRMEAWIHSDEAKKATANEVEKYLAVEGREFQRLMFEEHIAARGLGDVGETVQLEETGTVLGESRERKTSLKSMFGEVRCERMAYSARGERQLCPKDEYLSLPERSYTYGVQRIAAREIAKGPYEEASLAIKDRTGLSISKRSLEDLAPELAKDFDSFYEERSARALRSGSSKVLVGSLDSKGIPILKEPSDKNSARPRARLKKGQKPNKKKMATVGTVYTVAPYHRTVDEIIQDFEGTLPQEKRKGRPKPEHKRVWASLTEPPEHVFGEVAAEMEKRDPTKRKIAVCLTDGARPLQRMAAKEIGAVFKSMILILDLVHVRERLWKAAHAFHKEGSDEAQAWVAKYMRMILEGDAAYAVRGMRQSATKKNLSAKKKEVVEEQAQYFKKNLPFMEYDKYLKKGLPIASGAVEGACKNLIKDRFERSGMRWSQEGAEAVLKLRALERSRDLETYLEYHQVSEHQRLYESRPWKVPQLEEKSDAA